MTLEITNFENLYGIDQKKKIKEWRIKVTNMGEYSLMEYNYGYIDGKRTECIQRISSGKNIGKKNETTHYQQAVLDATSKWKKKKDEGYLTELMKIEEQFDNLKIENDTLNVDHVSGQGGLGEIVFPMLAQDYNKYKSKLVYPCYIQPKLDGYRMLFNSNTGNCTSRQGKEFEIIKQTLLYTELKTLNEKIVLDGELYIHGGIFEHLGILRKKKLSNDDQKIINDIEYHVYDFVDKNNEYENRYVMLNQMFKDNNFKKIKLVKTLEIQNENDLKQNHLIFVDEKYEGTIIRNKNGKYKCKYRSTDLLKYKDFEDAEFKIVDYTHEIDTSSKDEKLIVWVCQLENGDRFNVRPKGVREERKLLYKDCQNNFNKYANRNLWVKYFELTDKKIPRFPCTKTDTYKTYIRDQIE
jgi:ATP-dependent DNA ligase